MAGMYSSAPREIARMDKRGERVRVERLSKRYGCRDAVRDINFTLRAGEITALLGPNGSGKTTIIKAMVGLIDYEGVVEFNGKSVVDSASYLARVGVVLEGSRNVHWRLTVEQNALYFLGMRQCSRTRKNRCLELMELLGIAQHRNTVVAKLSTGNRQKTSLLCALIHDPQLVLMDEPTLGLDTRTVDDLQGLMVREARCGDKAIMVTSHDLQFVDRICTRIIVIYEGCVVFAGPIEDLKSRLFLYQARLDVGGSIADGFMTDLVSLNTHDTVAIEQSDDGRLRVNFNKVSTALEIANIVKRSALPVQLFECSRTTMEQAYKDILGARP